jgi:hypothetical protein
LFTGAFYVQSPNATLTGRFTDPSNDVNGDAKVTVINDDTGIRQAGIVELDLYPEFNGAESFASSL